MKKNHDEIAARKRKEKYSKIWFKKAIELLENQKISPLKIVDVGAGKGEFLEILREKYTPKELWAIDYAETNIKILKEKGFNIAKR